jgi:hypothetical protein
VYCEDYPCCGHTMADPCDRGSMIVEPWYCDYCGYNHRTLFCPLDDIDEDDYGY